MKIAVICPTYNAGHLWTKCLEALKNQSINFQMLIIDSGSTDNTVELAKKFGFKVITINHSDFNHGGTRNYALKYLDTTPDILIYLTQDAILASKDSLKNIIEPFIDKKIGAVCGRQLPHIGAKMIASHARVFNYPSQSLIKDKSDIEKLGIKVAFMSNSYAAYRYVAFCENDGFSSNTIFGEDMLIAAKMILNDWKIAYNSEATVYHSHSYSLIAEFRRYFDVGVFHSREKWIKQKFGGAGSEGIKFVISELNYLLSKHKIHLIPEALCRTFLKFVAFKLGTKERYLSLSIKRKLSMNKGYWK